jgi:hypothetical protein
MEQTECSETSEFKIQAPGNYPEESTQQSEVSLMDDYFSFSWPLTLQNSL